MSFELEMRAAELKITQASEKAIRATALQLFTQVIERTPVGNPDGWKNPAPPGYIGGTARGNWRTAIGRPETATVDNRPEAQATGEVNLAVARFTLADTIHLSNNLPYIQRLENGWSQQAPAGMVAVTVNEFERVIESEARRNRV